VQPLAVPGTAGGERRRGDQQDGVATGFGVRQGG
jgi:hypothetical protein